MPARSRDVARRRRSFGCRRKEARKLSPCRGASVRSVKFYAKRPRCRTSRPRCARPQLLSPGKRSAGTSHALAGAARNSRNAAALERLRILARVSHAHGPNTSAYPSGPSELNLRKATPQEGNNRGRLQHANRGALCVPSREIHSPVHGPGARAYHAARTTADQGADRGTESCLTGMGSPLQAGPRPRALPPTRRLDRAADTLASVQTLAEPRVETPSGSQALRRVWACQPPLVNTFSCL